jgi:hypothetical protein
MSANPAVNISGRIGLVVLAGASALLSGYSCIYGATLSGLREGGWNWQFIPFIFGGWAFGALTALAAIVFTFISFGTRPVLSLTIAFMAPLTLSFVGGIVAFPLLRYSGEVQTKRNQEIYETEQSQKATYLQLARNDPAIVIEERWLDKWDLKRQVLNTSMIDGSIPFTEDQLDLIFKTWGYPEVFRHPSCSPEFLSSHFTTSLNRAREIDYSDLAAIVSNPATPLELVEKVASSDNLPWGAVGPAKQAVEKRNQTK